MQEGCCRADAHRGSSRARPAIDRAKPLGGEEGDRAMYAETLMAVHQACVSPDDEESELALAGGGARGRRIIAERNN